MEIIPPLEVPEAAIVDHTPACETLANAGQDEGKERLCGAFCGLPCSQSAVSRLPRRSCHSSSLHRRRPLPAPSQSPAPSSSKVWVGRYEVFEEFLRTAEIERTTNGRHRGAGDQTRLLQARRVGGQRGSEEHPSREVRRLLGKLQRGCCCLQARSTPPARHGAADRRAALQRRDGLACSSGRTRGC